MPMIRLDEGVSVHCAVDDYVWPWDAPTSVLIMHAFANKSRIASELQKILARALPRGRLGLFAGYGHGVRRIQPERCARAGLDFRGTVEGRQQ